MKPRERVLMALNHRELDRVPIDLGSCGPSGIHVLASVHNIEADVPGENIWAMVQAARRYGRYPLQLS